MQRTGKTADNTSHADQMIDWKQEIKPTGKLTILAMTMYYDSERVCNIT